MSDLHLEKVEANAIAFMEDGKNAVMSLAEHIRKLEKELAEVKEANRWRDVKEEMPKKDGDYLTTYDDWTHIHTNKFINGEFHFVSAYGSKANYWKPIEELKESGVDHG